MIKQILEKYNKIPIKSLGQNFLSNPETSKKIAGISLNNKDDNAGVLEIGPGLGALTCELCKIYKKVVAVEIDKTFEPALKELEFENLKIIFDDFLKIDLNDLITREFAGFDNDNINVCANLPYYITTPIVLKLVTNTVKFNSITVMIQKEAADKLCSKAGDKDYNAVSAVISYYGQAKKMFNVPCSDFYPQPKVVSTIVNILQHSSSKANPKDEKLMFKVIEAAFGQRRKILVNALSSGFNLDKEKIAEIVEKVTGNVKIRGEELDIKKFADIADLIFETEK